MSNNLKLMIMGDSPWLGTGYGVNTLNLLDALNELGHNAVGLALGHAGDVVRYKGMEVYPANTMQMLEKSVAKFRPDILIHNRDNWVFIPKYGPPGQVYSLLPMCHAYGAHLINYTPVQATPLPPEFVQTITTEADFTMITNQTGIDSLISQGAPAEKLGLLYNGVNPQIFHYTERPTIKESNIPKGKKMAIFVGANMDYRKATPLAMKAFQIYDDEHHDAVLYLHANPLGGFDLPLHMQNMNLVGRCFLKSNQGVKLGTWDLTNEEMAQIFNVGDAYITLTAAEGFNTPALEALACGLPIVITDTPIHREIFGRFPADRVFFVKATATTPTVWALEHNADPVDGAKQLEKAFAVGRRPIDMKQWPEFSFNTQARKIVEYARKVVDLPFEHPTDIAIRNMERQLELTKEVRAKELEAIAKKAGLTPVDGTVAAEVGQVNKVA